MPERAVERNGERGRPAPELLANAEPPGGGRAWHVVRELFRSWGKTMGWHRWLMKHGIGSPGHIARRMARHYRAAKEARPYWSEREVLNAVYAMRVAAQSMLGGPVEYRMTKGDFTLKT